jgi:hypothetical protein
MWTKSQKVSGGVLALAVVAFAVDRFVLDGGTPPAEAETAEQLVVKPAAPAAPSQAGASVTSATAATATTPKGVSLASRLAALAEARRFQAAAADDAFRPSGEWLAAAFPPPPAPKAEQAKAKPAAPVAPKLDHAGAFVRSHTLDAVMKNKGGGMAIINGKLYRPGQYVDGFKLTKVGLKDARFWGKGQGATLKLAGQPEVADAR